MSIKVSILIPCYNAEQWIAQSIESALDQTYPNKEVIVVDDGSTDGSLDIIKSFGDRIKWETQINQGGNVTRNRLLELSTGEWLQYLDADDYLLPDKIERQVDFSQKQKADIIYSPIILEYSDENALQHKQEILNIPAPYDVSILLARWYLPQTGSPLWLKQAIIDVGSWKIDQPCCQEHELYLRLLMAGKRFEYFPEIGAVYRQWSETTVCKRNKFETQQQRLLIKDRLEEHLKQTNQLNKERLNAINQARFECARIIFLTDKHWARKIIEQIQNNDTNFIPSGNSAPVTYRLVYRLFGFNFAEKVADLKRKFFAFH